MGYLVATYKNEQGNFNPAVIGSWNFKSRAIIRAVIEDAKANYGLDQAQEVLLGGSSAGGFGALFNLSSVKELLPSQTRFAAFVEAGFPTNAPELDLNTGLPADPEVYPFEQYTARGTALWNAQPDSFCVAVAAAEPSSGINCYEPASLLAAGATPIPIFIRQTLTDVNFMAKLGVKYNNATSEPVANATNYVQSVRDMTRARLNATHPKYSLMGLDEYSHVVLGSRAFVDNQYSFSSLNQLTTIQRQLYEYYLDPCSPKRLIQ